MIELTPVEKIIARLLVDSAIQKRGNYIYSELSDALEKEYSMKVNVHYGLSIPLGNIAILCNDLSLPLLSVRVQYKNDNSGKTAEGFYNIACELKPEYKVMKPQEVRRIELDRTRTCTEWQRLIDYLDGQHISMPSPRPKSLAEQYDEFIAEIITQYGTAHTLTRNEIILALNQKYGTNPDSILPSDFCYNRWNKGLPSDQPQYLIYEGRDLYKVCGKNYAYTGLVWAHPKGDIEQVVGYCVKGKKYLGKPSIYPDDLPDVSPEYLEGKRKQVTVNIHERNPAARQACIEKHGAICFICGFDFGKTYGEEFDGMIHVHHLKMVSKADSEYIIDPEKDLRPVCPNCHMVLHSKPGGYTIDEVKAMLQ